MNNTISSVNYDVAVVGGGVAGVAAAVQAARSGKKTVLIEKTILLGGLATSGLIYMYLPLCDGNGHQVTFGISEELLHNSIKYGPGDIPPDWRQAKNSQSQRLTCNFSPASFMLALEELLQKENVDIWYDTLVCGTEIINKRVTALWVENESGRGKINAKTVIDASGSAVVSRRAGIPCLSGDNYLTMWAMHYEGNSKDKDFGENLSVKIMTSCALASGTPLVPVALLERMFGKRSEKEYTKLLASSGINGKALSTFVQQSHKMLLESYKMRYESGKYDRKNCYPVKLPLIPQYRKIYCVNGEYVLNTGENAKYFEDSIGLLADWRKPGEEYVWEIPFRTLYAKEKIGGLIAAGRCTAAQGDAWEITRVIPGAAMTGQVAGLAASMSIDSGCEVWDLDIKELQKKLRELGFPIHRADIGI